MSEVWVSLLRRSLAGVSCCLLLLLLPVPTLAQFTHITNNGTITITGYTGPGGDLIIPDTINGLPVTQIGDSAFYGVFTLTNVTLPAGLTTIGDDAFRTCTQLTNIVFPGGLLHIGESAFAICSRLRRVVLPHGLRTLSDSAFGNCTSLSDVYIPGSVGRIGIGAFSGCTQLTNVHLGQGVNRIDIAAFYYCTQLKKITLPRSLVFLDHDAFGSCFNLQWLFFAGNAPTTFGYKPFGNSQSAFLFYLPGATGWSSTFAERSAILWNPTPQTGATNFGVGPNGFGFQIMGTPRNPLVVEASTTGSNWIPLFTNDLIIGTTYFSDPYWTNYPNRVYRIRSP